MTFYLILTFSAFLLSLLGTRVAILTARKRISPLDRHGKPRRAIPSNGGVVIVMALIICLLIADINYGIVLSMFLLAAISLLSDIIDIPMLVRWLAYTLAVLIPVSMLDGSVFGDLLPLWMDKTLTVLLWVWFIHVFTIMDGIDGITPTEMICIATGLALIVSINGGFPNSLSVYGLIAMSAGCGFFWWNWHPAKILLGEVGSAPIGFLMGYLLLMAIASGYAYAAAILPAYYISDAIFSFLRRLIQGKPLREPHMEYYYQLAVKGGRKHDSVVRYIFGMNFMLGLLATFSVLYPELALFFLTTAYGCTFVVLRFFAFTPRMPHEPF